MITVFETAFDQLYSAQPSARARVRYDAQQTIDKALCSGIGQEEVQTDIGPIREADVEVRYKASDEKPYFPLISGVVIEIKMDTQDVWQNFRIDKRTDSSGVVVLVLNAEYE